MIAVIDKQRMRLQEICRKFNVRRLEVFGSAADGTFDPTRSDMDFLVEFDSQVRGSRFESYFGLLEALQDLFGCKIDLVEPGAMRNPYFIRRVNETRTLVYDA